MMTQQHASTPIVEGLFEIVEGTPKLIGSQCHACNTIYFPQALSCRNPKCRDKSVEQTFLPHCGTLYSYTVQRYQPPPLFRIDDWAPYALGLVDLGDGLQVMGMLTGIKLDEIAIGMALKLVVEPLYSNADIGEKLTYKFAPAEGAGAA